MSVNFPNTPEDHVSELATEIVCISDEVRDVTKDKPHTSIFTQYMVGVAASMSIFSAGAWYSWVTPILPDLLGPDSPVPMTEEEASWMVSCIEIGCFFTTYPATVIADRIGRKWSILLSLPLFTISFLLVIFAKNYFYLCVSRTLQGIALSIPYTVLPLYLGEIASSEVRGTVTSLFYIFYELGCLLPFVLGPFLSYDSLTYVTFATTLIFALCFMWQPESPYFYAMSGNTSEISKALVRLRDFTTDEAIEKEKEEIQLEVKTYLEEKASWSDIVATPADRRALFLTIIVGSVSLLSGQPAIESYTTETFTRLGYKDFPTPNEITFVMGFVAFIGSTFSSFSSDRYGRRFLLFFSSIGCMVSLFIASLFFYLQTHSSVDMQSFMWVSPLAIIVYNMFVNAGMLPVSITYCSELFPTKTRGIAAAITSANVSICAFIVLKTYLPISNKMGGVFFIHFCYCIVCLIGLIIFFYVIPETKGKTFLEVRQSLG